MPDQTPLQKALAEACEFAIRHGVDGSIRPDDFGIQRSDIGLTTATYVDGDHAVSVTVDRYGHASFGVADLYWVHLEADESREPCTNCGECANCGEVECECAPLGRPMTTVHLPGDAPAAAYRDDDGNIRFTRDDMFIATGAVTRDQLAAWVARYEGDPRDYAAAMRERYRAALDLISRETGDAPAKVSAHA
ncbi:hypothetical protein [Nocardia xishanensis]